MLNFAVQASLGWTLSSSLFLFMPRKIDKFRKNQNCDSYATLTTDTSFYVLDFIYVDVTGVYCLRVRVPIIMHIPCFLISLGVRLEIKLVALKNVFRFSQFVDRFLDVIASHSTYSCQ